MRAVQHQAPLPPGQVPHTLPFVLLVLPSQFPPNKILTLSFQSLKLTFVTHPH